jgi:hypothetical protein
MATVIYMAEQKRSGRPRSHLLINTPLGRWVLRNFKGDYLKVAKEMGIDLSALERVIKGELNLGQAFDVRFWTYLENELCPLVAAKIGVEAITFAKWANGSYVPSAGSAKVIKYFSEKYAPQDPLDLDALLDYQRSAAA